MVEEMTDALNGLWGCPPAARRQAPAGTPVPAAGRALVLSELRQAAARFGPCPEGLDGPGALEELRISQSYEGDATLVAPVSFDLVDPISLPPAGSQPAALETIDEMAGQNIAHRLKELLLPRQLGMERIKEAGPRRLYTDPALRNPRLYATVVRRLMSAGLVDFSSSAECYVGMFFVRKKNGSLRMILDGRHASLRFAPADPVELATGSAFAQISVDGDEPISIGGVDICDAFCQIELPQWLRRYFGLPKLRAGDLGLTHLSDGAPVRPSAWVVPCFRCPPMGWSISLWICQSLNEAVTARALPGHFGRRLVDRRPAPDLQQGMAHAVYVDNFIALSHRLREVRDAATAVQRELTASDLPSHPVEASVGGDALGWHFDEDKPVIGLSVRLRWRLRLGIGELLERGWCSGRTMMKVISHFTSRALIRRELLSCLGAVYGFMGDGGRERRRLTPAVRRELTWRRALLPLCFRDAGRPLSPVVSCVDASWWGAGVTEKTITSDQARRLFIFNERWRFSRDGEQQVAPRDKALALESKQAERITSSCIKQGPSEPDRDPAVIAAVMEQQAPFRVEPKPNQEEEVTFEEVPVEALGLWEDGGATVDVGPRFHGGPCCAGDAGSQEAGCGPGCCGYSPVAVQAACGAGGFSAPSREQSVGDATRADYQRRQAAFSLWACQRGHSLVTPAEVDNALVLFFHEEFLDGGESSDAWKLMAALAFVRSDLGPRQGRLPRAARAAKGWSRLAPPRSRLPLPWPVVCLIVETLCRRGLVVYARLTALTFGLYLRPRETLDLAQSQLIPPGFTTATAMHHWCVVLHLFERQTPSKTGVFDESLLVDSTCFPWMPGLVQELHRRTPAGHRLFPVTYAQWNYHFKAVVVELGLQVLGNLTLHQLRHGGASHELYAAARPLRDIQKRGRWATDAALRRYAKGGRVQEQLHRLPRALQLRAEQAFRGRSKAGVFLEVFSGSGRMSAAWRLRFRSQHAAFELDIRHDADGDLLLRRIRQRVRGWVRSRLIVAIWIATPCHSMSRARNRPNGPPPLRTRLFPLGLPGLSPGDQLK
ncbi:unnamed protein product, partial [Prorocentrum cordatum]